MNHDDPVTTRAPIRTRRALYTWGELEVEVNETEDEGATLSIRSTKSYRQLDERSTETVLTIEIEDADDLVRLIQHALLARETDL